MDGNTNTSVSIGGYYACGHCGSHHSGVCPRIKRIEYWPDGTVKEVEYHGAVAQTSSPTAPR